MKWDEDDLQNYSGNGGIHPTMKRGYRHVRPHAAHVRRTLMAFEGGARNAKLRLFAVVCAMLVLAIASVPSLVFVFPDWGLSSERLEEIAANQNVSFINGSSCNVEVALPSSLSRNLFEQEGVQQRLLSLAPSLLPLLSTPKCSPFLDVLFRPQSASSQIFQTLSPFEIRGIMRTLNISYDQLTAGIGLANISNSALVSLMNSYCLDDFSNLGCQKDLTFQNGSTPCCYVSCFNWQWLGETKTTIDSVLFAVTAIVGLVEFVAASVAIIAIKSKQKFPHLVVSFYIMISLVSLIFVEAVGRILGREKAICCDESDLLRALQSDSCTFSIIRTIVQNFCFTAGVSWCVVGFVNLWFAIVLSKSRVFAAHRNAIHAIEASLVWGISLILALIPYWFKGGGAYYNPLLCYACSIINSTSFNYFTLVLPQQVIMAVGGLCVVHLVYTLKKQSFNRKELFASVQGQDAKQTKHVSQLDDLQRRFVFLLIVVFIVEIVVILNGFIVVMVRNSVDLDNLGGYVECVYLDLNDECRNAEKSTVENMTFAFLIVYRVAILCSLFFLVAFFWAAKDFRQFWKDAYRRVRSCCRRTPSDDKVDLDKSYSETSQRLSTARTSLSPDLELR